MSALIYGQIIPARKLFDSLGLLAPAVEATLKAIGTVNDSLTQEWQEEYEEDCASELAVTHNEFECNLPLRGLRIAYIPFDWISEFAIDQNITDDF